MLLLIGMLSITHRATYFDGPVAIQKAEVRVGPYQGLHGLPWKAHAIERLTEVLRERVSPEERLVVFYDYPAAYLVVPSRPGLPTSWTDRRARLALMLDYYDGVRTGRGHVLKIGKLRGLHPRFEDALLDPARLEVDGDWFRLYREPPPAGR